MSPVGRLFRRQQKSRDGAPAADTHAPATLAGVAAAGSGVAHLAVLERALRDSEIRQWAIMSSLDAGVIYQTIDGVLAMNPSAERILGVSAQQLGRPARLSPGQIWVDAAGNPLADEDLPFEIALRTGIVLTGIVVGIQQGAAPATWLLVNARPVFAGDADAPYAAVTSFTDITQLREREARQQEAEHRYRTLVEQIPAITYITAPDEAGSPIYISPRLETALGYQPENWVGNRKVRIAALHPDDAQRVIEAQVQSWCSGEPFRMEYRMVAADGRIVWVHDECLLVRNHEGIPVCWQGIILDVSERKRSEAALHQSRMDLKTLTDNVPDGIVRYNRDCQRIYVNPALARAIGKPIDEIIGTTVDDLSLNADHSRAAREAIGQVFQRGQMVEVEFDHPSPSGIQWRQIRFIPEFDTAGLVDTVLGISRDITERRRVQDALAQGQRELTALTDNAPDAIARFDREYRHVFVNPALATMMARTTDEVIGMTIWDTSRNGVVTAHWAASLERVFTSGAALETEFEYPSVQGPRWLQARLVPEFDAEGSVATVLSISRDITAARAADMRLRESQQLFRSAFDDAVVGMALVSNEGRFVEVNGALCAMLGYSSCELMALDFQTITHADDLGADLEHVQQLLVGSASTYQMEKRYICKDGEILWTLLGVSIVRDAGGQPLYFIAQIQDINERKRLELELSHRAYHDPLTDLPNRGLFEDRLEHALARSYRRRTRIAVMYLDLDGFKAINDTLGHGAGDRMLTEIGQRIHDCLRMSDTVARLGGDEFTVLLEDVLDIMAAVRIADRIIASVRQPFDFDGEHASISVSIGVAFSHEDGEHPEDASALLSRADAALYEAKRRGKNRYALARMLDPTVAAVE
jgi:diguanylate cyclase (GGDEF)-like protein/PAS domain S-box-containing protein